MTTDLTLGGRFSLDDWERRDQVDYAGAPRDEDDDALERLLAQVYDLINAEKDEPAVYKAICRRIGMIRVRQNNRTTDLLAPLYAIEDRNSVLPQLRLIQSAEARRIWMTFLATDKARAKVWKRMLDRADEIIRKYSQPK